MKSSNLIVIGLSLVLAMPALALAGDANLVVVELVEVVAPAAVQHHLGTPFAPSAKSTLAAAPDRRSR